jgi:hypothetical protein
MVTAGRGSPSKQIEWIGEPVVTRPRSRGGTWKKQEFQVSSPAQAAFLWSGLRQSAKAGKLEKNKREVEEWGILEFGTSPAPADTRHIDGSTPKHIAVFLFPFSFF